MCPMTWRGFCTRSRPIVVTVLCLFVLIINSTFLPLTHHDTLSFIKQSLLSLHVKSVKPSVKLHSLCSTQLGDFSIQCKRQFNNYYSNRSSLNDTKSNFNASDYVYSVKHVVLCTSTTHYWKQSSHFENFSDAKIGYVLIVIIEKYQGMATKGGSAFHVTYNNTLFDTNKTIQNMCPVVDSFDGEYRISCPIMYGNNTIVAQLKGINFTLYRRLTKLAYHILLETTINCEFSGDAKMNPMCYIRDMENTAHEGTDIDFDNEIKYVKIRETNDKLINGYTYHNGVLKWVAAESLHDPLSNADVCRCVYNFTNIYALGASHMRYQLDYIFKACFKLPIHLKRKHDSIKVGNINYNVAKWMFQTQKMLEDPKWINENNATLESSVLIIQTGAHDTAYAQKDFFTVINKSLPSLIKALNNFRNRYNIPIVFMSTPSVTDICAKGKKDKRDCLVMRNNFILGAMNANLRESLAAIDIPLIDAFSITLPVYLRTGDGIHYLLRYDNTFVGEIGHIVLYEMLRKICPTMGIGS